MTDPPESLFRRWVHVREEDRDGVRAYRAADRPVPPGRGRESIEFRRDGTFVDARPGPVDKPIAESGRWRADGPRCLRVSSPAGRHGGSFEIVSVDDAVLRLRPLPTEGPGLP